MSRPNLFPPRVIGMIHVKTLQKKVNISNVVEIRVTISEE